MRILIAGDSLGLPRPHRINNYSPEENDLAIRYEDTYSSIINKKLMADFKMNPFVEMINRSRRAQTIIGVSQEFADHLYFYEPEVIIMQVGIVDCWFREHLNGKQMVNRKNFKEHLLKIVGLLSERPRCRLIIIGISPTSVKMQDRYPGIIREIRLYNQVLKAVVNYKNIFYIDMEKYVKPIRPQEYLLPDDHHLNRAGNQLVAKQAIGLLKGFIYADCGIKQYEKKEPESALKYFEKSYQEYPGNLYNLYNLMVMYFGNKQIEKLNLLIRYVKENKIGDPEILNIVSVVEDGGLS